MDFLTEHSESNWCESKYNGEFLPYLKEPLNTISGLIFLAVAYKLSIQFKCPSINYLIQCIYFVGVGTFLYHASLFRIFKIIDQISILVLLMACSACYLGYDLEKEKKYISLTGILCSFIFFFKGMDYILVLCGMLMVIYTFFHKRYRNVHQHLLYVLIHIFILSFSIWIFDKQCYNGFHTHWLFHCTISLLAYNGVIFLYTINKDRYIL